jgi:hypothetical protein
MSTSLSAATKASDQSMNLPQQALASPQQARARRQGDLRHIRQSWKRRAALSKSLSMMFWRALRRIAPRGLPLAASSIGFLSLFFVIAGLDPANRGDAGSEFVAPGCPGLRPGMTW